MAVPLTGKNGDNETHIGSRSRSLDFSLFDEKYKEIDVHNLSTKNHINVWIAKDTSIPIQSYQYINMTHIQSKNQSNNDSFSFINGFLVTGFNLNPSSNLSIHIQIKPQDTTRAYLTLIKFGQNPSLSQNFDLINLVCPNELKHEGNDSFYLIFVNMSRVDFYKTKSKSSSYVGFSLIELDPNSLDCTNKTVNLNSLQNQTFKSNLWLRTYCSGCYYLNKTNSWSNYGMEIYEDTNLTHTHCTTNHLTSFAGGFVVLPNAIDFSYVWSHASFLDNPVIYSTVIALVCLYILLGIWSRWMDKRDKEKMGVTVISSFGDVKMLNEGNRNNLMENSYIYEIVVCTGARPNAGTKSNVTKLK